MMSRQWVVCLSFVALFGAVYCAPVTAQIPDVIYTWDHAFGEAAGPDSEVWSLDFGNNTLTLDNTVDGTLTVTETGTAGADWAIRDSFNRIKESVNPADYGALDLTGLSGLQIDIGHDGASTINGQLFAHVTPSSNFVVLGPISVAPGPVQTYNISLAGLTPAQLSSMRTLGVQIFDHAADGNRTWQINEIRSAGTPLGMRLIADHNDGAADFDGVITNFEETAVVGHTGGKNNSGLSINTIDGALQWQETAGAPGVALEWGNNNNQYEAENFAARPMDLRNYPEVETRIRIQSQVPGEMVGVQYYMQVAPFNYFAAGPDQMIPADGQYHVLRFPLSGIPNRDQVNIHGINFGSHQGLAQFRVDYVKYIPEPAGAVLLLIGGLAAVFSGVRRRS